VKSSSVVISKNELTGRWTRQLAGLKVSIPG